MENFSSIGNSKKVIALSLMLVLTIQVPLAFAISQDAVTVEVDDGATSFTFDHTVSGSERVLLVGVSHRQCLAQAGPPAVAARDVTGVTYNGLALTKIIGPNDRLGACSDLWYRLAPTLGTHTVKVDFNLAPNAAVMSAMSFTGVDQITPIGDSDSAHDAFTSSSPSVTVNADTGDLVVDVLTIRNDPATVTKGAGQSLIHETANMDLLTGAASSKVAASPVTMTWTASGLTNPSDGWAQVAAVLNAAPNPVGGQVIPLETTSLIITGTHLTASWIIPAVVSAVGISLVFLRKN